MTPFVYCGRPSAVRAMSTPREKRGSAPLRGRGARGETIPRTNDRENKLRSRLLVRNPTDEIHQVVRIVGGDLLNILLASVRMFDVDLCDALHVNPRCRRWGK